VACAAQCNCCGEACDARADNADVHDVMFVLADCKYSDVIYRVG
jgi:hypothetical protein